MSETIYFEKDAKNVSIRCALRITGRGLGVVESVLTSDYTFLTEHDAKVYISTVFRVCLRFNDKTVGYRLLLSKDRLPVAGYGTYMPDGRGVDTVWRTLI
jgi:hypothetical protein